MVKANGDNGAALGLVGGMFLGVLVFAVTQNPIWIALGPCIFLPVGMVIARIRHGRN